MTYWYVDNNGTGIHYSNTVPTESYCWGLCDERGVYHFANEQDAQDCVDRNPVIYNLVREGTTVRMKHAATHPTATT